MDFKHKKVQLIGRIAFIGITILYLTNMHYQGSSFIGKVIVLSLVVLQCYYLYHYLDKSNKELIGFLESIEWDDFSRTYPERKDSSSLNELYHQFNKVMRKFREIRTEKEAQHQYLKTIVHHVGIGIITLEKTGDVQIINSAAKKLLNIRHLKNIQQLASQQPDLVQRIRNLRTGGRDLIKVSENGEDEVQLAVHAIELVMQGKEFKLVSLQNIQSELEEKEMEAWQNLIRVLTHEIMNSVTPISSLAATMECDMEQWLQNGSDLNTIDNETVEDFHTALHTIHRRSESLIKFVSDFRNMTHITLPDLKKVQVGDLIHHVLQLLKKDIEEGHVQVSTEVPEGLTVEIDEQQIEQVVINLVKNAIQALEENEEDAKPKLLTVKAIPRREGGATLLIIDNGPGIEKDALKKIFIPFFTTKQNGSGIGLSLSKQIMRHHKGSISVKSVCNEGTEFNLTFTS